MIGLTPAEHEHSAAIDLAADWLSITPDGAKPRPIVPHLRQAFGLTALEACVAIREASQRRAAA